MKKSQVSIRSSTLLPAENGGCKKAARNCAARRCLPALAKVHEIILRKINEARAAKSIAQIYNNRTREHYHAGKEAALMDLWEEVDRMETEAPAGNKDSATGKT